MLYHLSDFQCKKENHIGIRRTTRLTDGFIIRVVYFSEMVLRITLLGTHFDSREDRIFSKFPEATNPCFTTLLSKDPTTMSRYSRGYPVAEQQEFSMRNRETFRSVKGSILNCGFGAAQRLFPLKVNFLREWSLTGLLRLPLFSDSKPLEGRTSKSRFETGTCDA